MVVDGLQLIALMLYRCREREHRVYHVLTHDIDEDGLSKIL